MNFIMTIRTKGNQIVIVKPFAIINFNRHDMMNFSRSLYNSVLFAILTKSISHTKFIISQCFPLATVIKVLVFFVVIQPFSLLLFIFVHLCSFLLISFQKSKKFEEMFLLRFFIFPTQTNVYGGGIFSSSDFSTFFSLKNCFVERLIK